MHIKRASKAERERLWRRVFSCEFCAIPKNTFFTEHIQPTVFEMSVLTLYQNLLTKISNGTTMIASVVAQFPKNIQELIVNDFDDEDYENEEYDEEESESEDDDDEI